ncbi:hypothetical protein BS47DRAFT_375650 [Hydnum rufescens UP504]|uniref:Fungal lipase-type domain-containing protein n=1 Tax=Hydnum rufescens UP504 TaxID=1448309 RepID=A0A9P6B713_9AGAM|nr:hypothetical protein BS47DRAFT_375650 [Hydnum rufescens UP504]
MANVTKRAAETTTVTAMTSLAELSYAVPAQFASAAYCSPSTISSWKCGANCNALPGFVTYGAGGDGSDIQYWYVGYDATHLNAIVVGHQGTNPSSLIADLTDLDIIFEKLDQTHFPGVPSTLEAHQGFLIAQSRPAAAVLSAVKAASAATGSKHVYIVGHSLGGAIALLDAVYLPLHLPGFTFSTSVFGLPRVGNPAFADYVDAHVTNFAHITNKLDPIPILPPRSLGYAHPSNEKHIVTTGTADGDWYACDGHDNTSVDCSTGAVPDILASHEADHDGPYGTIRMGC